MILKATFNAPADEQETSAVKQDPTPSLAKRLPASALVLAALLTGAFSTTHAYAGSSAFTVSSPDLASGTFDKKFTLNAFGCTGSNVSPSIKWSNLPAGTKSLALQVQDRDAPAGNSFWHWTVYNIPASATSLPQGAGNASNTLPAPAFNGANDFLDTGATGGNDSSNGHLRTSFAHPEQGTRRQAAWNRQLHSKLRALGRPRLVVK